MTLAQFPKFENFENLFFHAKLPEKAIFGYFSKNFALGYSRNVTDRGPSVSVTVDLPEDR